MELVTGAMGSLLPKLDDLLKEEYGLQKGVKKKIESLLRELRVVHAVLRKIGDVPSDQLDELVRLWVCDIREASYDMEDIVDAFLVHADGPEPTDTNILRRLLKKVGKFFEKSRARRKISRLIQDMNDKLKEVEARHGRYTLHNIADKLVSATTIDPRLLNLYKRATELVGIEGPIEDLINKLSLQGDVDMSDKKMMIVSVVGFGGLGKTTLARAVYDQLKPRFECVAFVPMGRNPDVKKVFIDILIELDKEKYTNWNMMALDERQLMDELKEFVKEKRCFIVIDDIWDKESWKLIICALQESHCGSRLVITTRISEVATYAGEAYQIQPLSRDNAKKLLYARIVDGEGKYFDGPSDEACDKILKKCGGVPLAIITIASLLVNKPGEYWSEVCNSIGFGHEDNDDVDNTRRILSFSYYDMPSHLRSCLLYLSVFPEDEVIEKNSLIWKWVAEGFIIIPEEQAAAGIGLFELGERYFNELINRSMIQPEEKAYDGCINACSVHDMVLDLIHSLWSKENFVTVLDGDEQQKLPGSIVRRLALRHVEVQNGGQLANIAVEKVRSLIASDCQFHASWPRLPVLRVLEMINFDVKEDCDEGVLDHLGSLHHLRYLRLQDGYYIIPELPREVRYLKFLQTLDLWYTDIEELPEEVGLLTQLVCLRIPRRMPAGVIGKLTSLQELWIQPDAGDDADDKYDDVIMHFVKELGLLRELRVLLCSIDVMSESMERALLESLGNLHNIRELHIEGSSTLDKGGTSDAGFVSYRHLRFLRLDCFLFSRLPAWIKSSLAPNLSYLEVKVLVVKEKDMETLARLPELRCLKLYSQGTKCVSMKICTEGVEYFRKLRILRISGTSIWFDLQGSSRVASTIMPSLESLEFDVHVGPLKDATLISFDKLLDFHNLGRTSLQRVTAYVNCGGALTLEVEEAEAALLNAAAAHPKHPTLQTIRLQDVLSPYEKACMLVRRNPELLNKAWKKMAKMVGSEHIQTLRMPDAAASSSKVVRLLYTNNGTGLLALSSNAVHKLWKWKHSKMNPRGKSTTSVPPQLWRPKSGILMTNDTTEGNPEEATACIALSKNDSYLISASGGRLTLFNTRTFKIMTTFMPPPPAATFVAFYPQDNNIVAIGTEDSSILIYDVRTDEVKMVLRGHHKKITGLVFSQLMNVLVSSGADGQLCVWSMDGWEKKNMRYIQPPSNHSGALVGDTMVQFHYDQTHLLVAHESQLVIYDWKLECLCSWPPSDALPPPISSAVYSSDGLLVYTGFGDGAIGIFDAESLTLQCRISSVSSGGGIIYPMVVAANPWEPNQMAVGMSDGAVYMVEPPLNTDNVEVGSGASSGPCPPGDSSSSGDGDGQEDV